MDKIQWLWVTWRSLTWWQMLLWVIYLLYLAVRSYAYYGEAQSSGILKGYKEVIFGYKPKAIRLYHIILILFDIPPAVLGLTFPFFKKIFTFKIYEFKEEEKEENK